MRGNQKTDKSFLNNDTSSLSPPSPPENLNKTNCILEEHLFSFSVTSTGNDGTSSLLDARRIVEFFDKWKIRKGDCITSNDLIILYETISCHYLSFENSLCLDYVTEKLYRPLQHDAIPVVYGGADYSLYLPAGSYVNAMDFDSPERLADHLNKLMVDDELYLTYFRWKAKYVVRNKPKDGMCQLCRLLRHPETNKDKSYADIAAWWAGGVNGTNQTCQPPPTKLVG